MPSARYLKRKSRPKVARFLPFAILFLLMALHTQFRLFAGSDDQSWDDTTLSNRHYTLTDSTNSKGYQVVTTHYGWTTKADRVFSRRIISKEFFDAILAHPNYNATAWTDLEQQQQNTDANSNPLLIAFLDIDTCDERNYPHYAPRKNDEWLQNNVDTENGRYTGGKYKGAAARESCQYLHRAATSPALLANPNSRLVILDCSGYPPENQLLRQCSRHLEGFSDDVGRNDQVMFAYYSQNETLARPGVDIGLPPPAINPIQLDSVDRNKIYNCNDKRQWLFSFQGRGGWGREQLIGLHNGRDVFVHVGDRKPYANDVGLKSGGNYSKSTSYNEIMKASTFIGAPRGDCFFSYRWSEIFSAGSIPVVYSDDWLLPFNKDVVDWTKCAVFIKEKDMGKTIEILQSISEQQRCEMQKYSLQVWDKYVSSRSGWLDGLIEAALSQREGNVKEHKLDSDRL